MHDDEPGGAGGAPRRGVISGQAFSPPLASALLVSALLAIGALGCVRSMAVNSLGDALAQGGGVYASDDDPELVRDATAFGLKTIESLLASEPEHAGLLLAAARGFTQYSYAFVQSEADYAEEDDYPRAARLQKRARRLYLRARTYGLRGLDLRVPNFEARVRADTQGTLAQLDKDAIPLLRWTALSWGAAIGLDKDDVELAADLDLVGAMMRRALALDETHKAGALHDFFITWEGGRPAAAGADIKLAKVHLDRALALSDSQRLGPLVAYAQTVLVKQRDAKAFGAMLGQVIDFDADAPTARPYRLANLIAQRRARWLLAQREDLFVE